MTLWPVPSPGMARHKVHSTIAMNSLLQQALVDLAGDRMTAAIPYLENSLAIYQRNGDPLACATIRLYLAYAALRNEQIEEALSNLARALPRLAGQTLDPVPAWWNPQIVAELCAYAIAADLYPDRIRQICLELLGEEVIPVLTRLSRADTLETRQRAYQLLFLITEQENSLLAHLPDTPAKAVIYELLFQGALLANGYPQLESELRTAHQYQRSNPVIVAVFALYTLGYRRIEIAQRIDCSIQNVRNYITVIYRQFALPPHQFGSRAARRKRLVQIACERGYISDRGVGS